MPGISIHYFPKDVAAWQNGRVSIVDIEEILLFNVVSLMPRTGFEDACNEHIALVKSGEDNQWIQLRRMLIKEPVFTPYTIVQHSFREPLIVVYFTRLRCTDTPCFSTWLHFHFSYRMKTLPIVVSIVLTDRNTSFVIKLKPFPDINDAISLVLRSVWPARRLRRWPLPLQSLRKEATCSETIRRLLIKKIIVPRDTADSFAKTLLLV